MGDCEQAPAAFSRTYPSARYDAETGRTVVGWDRVARSDYVGGGFYQPTTRAQRAELYAELLAAHARAWPSGEGAAYLAAGGSAAELSPPAAAALAAALPPGALHALRTPSGYVALDARGRPVQPGSALLPGTLPLATPALDESLFSFNAIMLPQFLPYARGDEGLFVVSALDGSVQWGFNSWLTDAGETVNFGRSRSSPVIDGDDFAYVAADIDDPIDIGSTIPVLFALDALFSGLRWASSMAFEPNTTVGSASPIVIDGYNDGNYAIMSASDGVVQVGEGLSCPTNDAAFECSGHGDCDCSTGECSCSSLPGSCFGGADCGDLCRNGGRCGAAGVCTCPPGYDAGLLCAQCDACHTGPKCAMLAQKCNNHGTCQLQPYGAPLCVCDEGWGGMGCTAAITPALTPAQAQDVTAAVLVPLSLLGVAAAGIFVWKRRNPGESVAAALVAASKSALGSVRAAAVGVADGVRARGGSPSLQRSPAFVATSSGAGGGEGVMSEASKGGGSTPAASLFATPGKGEGTKLLGRGGYGAL